ncbi:MAG: phosphate-starvation-inducible PsiE family protein [Planctomycetia bacterium]|nr:phosphate-starvation-inducible PsiE family protein [Planctomycetia bacterium]
MESFKAYLSKKEIHVEVVLTVALIAVAHKILLINVHEVQYNVLGSSGK